MQNQDQEQMFMSPAQWKKMVKQAVKEVHDENDNDGFKITMGSTMMFVTIVLPWIFGFVLAKGFWQTLFAVIPFYSWYLSVEHFARYFGVI